MVYSPLTGGRPASSAYAMPWGTRIAASTIPATTSERSQPESYVRSVTSPGTWLLRPVGGASTVMRLPPTPPRPPAALHAPTLGGQGSPGHRPERLIPIASIAMSAVTVSLLAEDPHDPVGQVLDRHHGDRSHASHERSTARSGSWR